MRTITVKGAGAASVRPDCIRITIDLRAKDADYTLAMELATMQTEELQQAVRNAGIKAKQLKTTSFEVHTEFESIQDCNKNWKQIMTGYCCSHQMVLELPLDLDLLSEVIQNVSDCDARPECRIAFTLLDPRAAEELLLRDAAANAMERAEILANASGCQLGELQSIDYRLGSMDPISATSLGIENGMHLRAAKFPPFTPEDIRLSEDVSFTWELE